MTIRTRVIVSIVCPPIVLVVGLCAAVYERVRADRYADLDASMNADASALAALVEYDHGSWDPDPVPDALAAHLGSYRVVDAVTRQTILASPSVRGDDLRVLTVLEQARSEPAGPALVEVTIAADVAGVEAGLRGLLETMLAMGALAIAMAVGTALVLARGIVARAAFERVRTAYEHQARFTADASHELRTPLAEVRARAEVALMREREPDEYREDLQGILDASARLERVVLGLLELARSDAGAPLDRAEVDLAALASAVASRARRPIAIDLGPAVVHGHAGLLEVAIENIVANAIRHTPRDRPIRIDTRRERDEVVVEIADEGEGMAPEAVPHVFGRFFRADDARSRDRGGAGLGLAIAKSIVERHGGTIALASTLGAGTRVSIRLASAGR